MAGLAGDWLSKIRSRNKTFPKIEEFPPFRSSEMNDETMVGFNLDETISCSVMCWRERWWWFCPRRGWMFFHWMSGFLSQRREGLLVVHVGGFGWAATAAIGLKSKHKQ